MTESKHNGIKVIEIIHSSMEFSPPTGSKGSSLWWMEQIKNCENCCLLWSAFYVGLVLCLSQPPFKVLPNTYQQSPILLCSVFSPRTLWHVDLLAPESQLTHSLSEFLISAKFSCWRFLVCDTHTAAGQKKKMQTRLSYASSFVGLHWSTAGLWAKC